MKMHAAIVLTLAVVWTGVLPVRGSTNALDVILAEDASPGVDPAIQFSEQITVLDTPKVSFMLEDVLERPDVKLSNNRAFAALQMGNYADALKRFKNSYLLDKTCNRTRFGIGTTFASMGRYKDAIKVFEPLLVKYPDDYFLKNNMAWMLATAKDNEARNPRAAIAMAQSAMMDAPGDHRIWSTLSEAYYAAGNYDKALRIAKIGLDIAVNGKAPQASLVEFQKLIIKCNRAVEAFSIMD